MKEQAKRRFSILDEPVQLCLGFILVLTFSVVAFPRAKNYQSHTANVNGVKIHYLKAGSGTKPLVLIHGFGDTSRMWVPLFEGLGKDYTIIAPDMRGLGDSSRPTSGDE